jgi:hypothetical protein
MRLMAKLVRMADVTSWQRDEMFRLMDEHYANVHRRVFDADLTEKRWVILLREAKTDRLRGFSTQALLEAERDGRPINALFSGDTIIHREFWGDRALAHAWGCFALQLIDSHPDEELYWFLISQGFRTYRFLPLFFHEFYPRHDAPVPPPVKAIIDLLARARYPEQYDLTRGVIRATPTQYRLRAGLGEITPERLRDPHISFFHFCNPGHSRGDELCCLAPLTRDNFTPAAYRVIGPEPMLVDAP